MHELPGAARRLRHGGAEAADSFLTAPCRCSVRAPRLRPAGSAEPEPYAREAKEFMRKLAIGCTADVSLEYSRKVTTQGPEPPLEPVTLQMGNIVLHTAKGAVQAAQALVRRGFATLQVRAHACRCKHSSAHVRAGCGASSTRVLHP